MSKILVVDDDHVSQRILGYTLKKAGHNIIIAFNGQEALNQLSQNMVDLVITDLSMPGMDGFELITLLRSDVRYQNLPVVMLTSSGQDEDREIARQKGITHFLTKPASSQELLGIVKRLLP